MLPLRMHTAAHTVAGVVPKPAESLARQLFTATCLPCVCTHLYTHCCRIVSKKYSKLCESVSNGFGEERHVAVVAKGKGSTR